MTIELPANVEKELEHIAVTQQRDIGEAASITDLDPLAVGEAQLELVGELRDIPEWKAD